MLLIIVALAFGVAFTITGAVVFDRHLKGE
jgi:hypothetical protein